MASQCIKDCLNIKSDAVCVQRGTTYANLYKWPVAEAEFVRSISHGSSERHTVVVDSITCRQMYLRSYTFSRTEENEDIRGSQDGDEAGDQRLFGGRDRKKAGKSGMRMTKTMLHRAFPVRLLRKCLFCTSSNKFKVEK